MFLLPVINILNIKSYTTSLINIKINNSLEYRNCVILCFMFKKKKRIDFENEGPRDIKLTATIE
jgi:hypothetical protein